MPMLSTFLYTHSIDVMCKIKLITMHGMSRNQQSIATSSLGADLRPDRK